MNERFEELVTKLDSRLDSLMAMQPVRTTDLPGPMPDAGIYLFSEDGKHLYVGRSNRLRSRLQEHSRPSSMHNRAQFAFAIARKKTKKTIPSYKMQGSRSKLEKDEEFAQAFKEAKERVRQMDIRFVEEKDPLRQALLEIYVAVALDTKYNDFETH